MSRSPVQNFSYKSIRELLAGAGSATVDLGPQPEVQAYDWRQCRYFNPEQWERLKGAIQDARTRMAEKVSILCHRPIDVAVTSVTQDYASKILQAEPGSADSFLGMGPKGASVQGALWISEATTRAWAQLLLGESQADDGQEGLSPLEQSLLMDIVAAVIGGFCESVLVTWQPAGGLTVGQWPIRWEPVQELVRVTLQIKKAQTEGGSEGSLVLPCSALEAMAGRDLLQGKGLSPEQQRQVVARCVGDVEIPVKVYLGSVVLRLEDVMGLRSEDVLVLDCGVEDPIELEVAGQMAFLGLPARTEGRQAVLLTALHPDSKTGKSNLKK